MACAVILDDHDLILCGLEQLAREAGVDEIHLCDSATAFLDLIEKIEPALMVFDVALPDGDAFQLVERARQSHPHIKSIALSAYLNAANLSKCVEQKVEGIISKNAGLDTVRDGMRAVLAGLEFVSEELQAELAEITTIRSQNLTPRELTVLSLIAGGAKSKHICTTLGISESTVEAHKNSIFRKLGVNSQVSAVVTALKKGILTMP